MLILSIRVIQSQFRETEINFSTITSQLIILRKF